MSSLNYASSYEDKLLASYSSQLISLLSFVVDLFFDFEFMLLSTYSDFNPFLVSSSKLCHSLMIVSKISLSVSPAFCYLYLVYLPETKFL